MDTKRVNVTSLVAPGDLLVAIEDFPVPSHPTPCALHPTRSLLMWRRSRTGSFETSSIQLGDLTKLTMPQLILPMLD